MTKTEKIKYIDGTEHEFVIRQISVTERNKLFNEYLNLNKFMKAKETDDITDFVKDNKSILDFMVAVLKMGIQDYDPDKVVGDQNDKLFENNFSYIVSLGGESLGN